MASENKVISIQLATPAGKAVEVFTHVYQRPPSASERATLTRICDAYRAAWGREADAEWICLSIASMAAARDTAAEAVNDLAGAAENFANKLLTATQAATAKITAAQAGATPAWRHRVWAAAALGIAAGAVGYYALRVLANDALSWAWCWTYLGFYAPLALAGALAGAAAMMAFPEAMARVASHW